MRKILSCFFAFALLIQISADAQFTKLLDFAGTTDGKYPNGDVLLLGGFLYGETGSGGVNDAGTLFKIKTDGTGYVKLLDFAGSSNGSTPGNTLITDNTYLYGMTCAGGTNGDGTIFKIKLDGTGYMKLLDLSETPSGSCPVGSLLSIGSYLYGMTAFGGTYGFGTIFKIKADGTGYIKLLDFVDSTSGKDPEASLVYDGTYMYGMTNWGGANNVGTIFKIKTDGSGYIKLLDFPGYPSGSRPHGGLISDGTYFYGMTMYGGVNGFGDVFKIKPDGSGYSIIHSFPSTIGGSSPWGSLLYDGTYLYGMTFYGGVNNYGTIFKIKPDATGFINMLDFADVANGALPYGSLISDGTFLYGMASSGGANSYGTLFKYSLAIGINEIDDPKLLSLSPNPFTGFIFVKSADVNKNQTFSITLSDLSGKILLHQKTSSSETKLNTEGIAAGFYLLRVEDERGVRNFKVVKEN